MRLAAILVVVPAMIGAVPTAAGDCGYVPTSCDYTVVPDDQTPGTGETTLSDTLASIEPGEAACLSTGIYRTLLNLTADGNPGEPIVFQNAPGARPVFRGATGVTLCATIPGDWNIVRGIECDGFDESTGAYPPRTSSGWPIEFGIKVAGDYNCVEDNYVHHAEKRGILVEGGHYNTVRGNRVEFTKTDSIEVRQGSTFNLVEGNHVRFADHHTLDVEESNHNVVRTNLFENPWWVAVSFRDIDGVAGNRNVFEDNELPRAMQEAIPTTDGWHVQFGTWETIVRRNVFRDGGDYGFYFSPSEDAVRKEDNRIYHNVLANNGKAGLYMFAWRLTGGVPTQAIEDNILANNLIGFNGSGSTPTQISVDHWDGDHHENPLHDNYFLGNAIVGPTGDDQEDVFDVAGLSETTLVDVEGLASLVSDPEDYDLVAGNLELPVSVVGLDQRDYQLAPVSAQRDAGGFLTYTESACSGTTVYLEDGGALNFSAGISDTYVTLRPGDGIQIEGDRTVYEITAVDVADDELTLAASVSCEAGRGVALAYDGARPDIGAREGFVGRAVLEPDVDGIIIEGTAAYGPAVLSSLVTGDVVLGTEESVRTLVSFDTSPIPDGVELLSARLQLTRASDTGNPNAFDFGQLLVEMKDGVFGSSAALELADFDAAADTRGVMVPRQGNSTGDVWWIDVSGLGVGEPGADGLDLINRSGSTQFRLAFEEPSDGDSNADLLAFEHSQATESADRPTLYVTYAAPSVLADLNASEGGVLIGTSAFGGNDPIGAGTLNGTEIMGFLSFDTSVVPSGHTVLGAELLIERDGDVGDPFTGAGDLHADVKAGPFNGNAALEGADATANADGSIVLVHQGETAGDVWGAILEPSWISTDDVTQIRIHFDTLPTTSGQHMLNFDHSSAQLRIYHQP